MSSKPLAAGRRKHHPILARDTGGDNSMFVVRDETRRREALDRAQHDQPPVVDTKHPVNQLQDRHVTEMHDVEKRHRPIRDNTSANPTPRKGWRK